VLHSTDLLYSTVEQHRTVRATVSAVRYLLYCKVCTVRYCRYREHTVLYCTSVLHVQYDTVPHGDGRIMYTVTVRYRILLLYA